MLGKVLKKTKRVPGEVHLLSLRCLFMRANSPETFENFFNLKVFIKE